LSLFGVALPFRRHPAPGLIFHSDRGSQYASNDYRKILRDFKMQSSMSRKGDCWDNAVTETLFGSLKVERLHGMRFDTRRLAKDEVIDWITFYNHRRLHSTRYSRKLVMAPEGRHIMAVLRRRQFSKRKGMPHVQI